MERQPTRCACHCPAPDSLTGATARPAGATVDIVVVPRDAAAAPNRGANESESLSQLTTAATASPGRVNSSHKRPCLLKKSFGGRNWPEAAHSRSVQQG